jgi:ribosomal protein L44E
MKIPKKTTRFCPFCKKRTEQKVDLVSTGVKRGTLTRGSIARTRIRGGSTGMGNHGKYSRKPIKSWKRKTKTTTRKVLKYICKECKKTSLAKKSRRVSKLMIE